MDYEGLFKKYQTLLAENNSLKAENQKLKEKLGILSRQQVIFDVIAGHKSTSESINKDIENKVLQKSITPTEKINLFMSLFRGREDVYAKRWENRNGKSGYTPVCLNEWKPGLCRKPKVKCAECSCRSYAVLDERVIEEHLRGNIVVGIYPMCLDETCYFLAIDFDDGGWQEDVSVLRDVCRGFDIPVAIERSRSGSGAHAWFFFEKQISAALARKLGTALLTYSMSKRHEISFKSYDRFFPNQDTMPKGGLGNLIALPLQKKARENDNSVFIDDNFEPYVNQWEFLGALKKLSEDKVETLVASLCYRSELGQLREDDDEAQKPWEANKVKLTKHDFPSTVKIVKANMLYIKKVGISQRALNALERLAAFKNPEFYRAQAMRMPTFNKPRVISCSDETEKYLILPRGCEADVRSIISGLNIKVDWADRTNNGRDVDIEFNGKLREEQQLAVNELIKHDNGVLSATTAFGKTVIAAKLIAERKLNTLILVHRQQLLSQWKRKLSEFLNIHEELPVLEKKRGRKKNRSLIGQIGAGKDDLSGIIDVAVMQSLNSGGEVKEYVKNYGMVIVDECHHIPAFSFEQILKNSNPKYVYGLTATPTRKDGHHPIIFMHCGPIRYRVDAKKQAEKRPFEHYVIPRFTGFRVPIDKEEKELTIQEIYTEIAANEIRNQLIKDDVVKSYENGRNSLILTERTAHVEQLAKKIGEKIPGVIALTGSMSAQETKKILAKISETPPDEQLTLISTGKYIGEGFDEPRLDTLFLAMPISWKGTLQQYAGRLHRLYESKNEVQIYDYIDVHVRMLEKMYNKRLSGYAAIGYKTKGESIAAESIDIIFDKNSFLPVYSNDIANAAREILIVSPFVTKKRAVQMLQYLSTAVSKGVKVNVITRPAEDFKKKPALEFTFSILKGIGINVLFKSNIHQKFAVIDQRIVWYGSINLLSFGNAEESIMRLESPNIANELMKSLCRLFPSLQAGVNEACHRRLRL
ncbi:MAG: DEAD/DEAH box helicase family protein [Bacillota bacterium]